MIIYVAPRGSVRGNINKIIYLYRQERLRLAARLGLSRGAPGVDTHPPHRVEGRGAERVAVGACRPAMSAVHERLTKGRQGDVQTNARDLVGGLLLAILLVVAGAALAGERSTGQAVDDTLITTQVKASFAADPQVSALAISVDTEQGVVTLSGVVESEAERQRTIQLAQGMEGVKRVDANQLLVKR
jgi:hyperosmotically inducible periplasmic protein